MKYFYLFIIGVFVSVIGITGCQKPDEEPVAKKPVLSCETTDTTVSHDSQQVTIGFNVENPMANGLEQMTASGMDAWITNVIFSEKSIVFDVAEFVTEWDEDVKSRTTSMSVSYPEAEPVVIKISQEAFVKDKPEEPNPVVSITWDENTMIPAKGGDFEVSYTITDHIEGQKLEATTDLEWVKIKEITEASVLFTVEANDSEPGSEPRNGSIALSYDKAENCPVIRFSQNAEEKIEQTFEIKIKELTPTSVKYDCIPSLLDATYVLNVMEKEEYEKFASDEEVIKADIEKFLQEDWFGNPGTIEENLKKGVEEDCYEYLYNSDTEYYIYAYGLDADGTVTTGSIYKYLIKTLASPEVVITWDNNIIIPIEGGDYEATFEIKNPIEGKELTASEGYYCRDWVKNVRVEGNKIKFTVDSSASDTSGSETRSGFITVSYPDAVSNPNISFKQTLPKQE